MKLGHDFVAAMERKKEISLTNLEKIYMVAKRVMRGTTLLKKLRINVNNIETSGFLAQDSLGSWPASKSGPRFETERIPNSGDFPSSVSNRVLLSL
ncbi:hypothetical protein PIB30_025159 [Stylosanthes scabra]|uniref:Uncharacterized protein n=1 Tax=Stylosanthes scabra TaxID=79078 RepID=A0ABU6Y766_9FABA|nr:hypothetical protein [Stylosanthes scabra]